MRSSGSILPFLGGSDRSISSSSKQRVIRRNSFGRITVATRKSEWAIAGFAALSFVGTLSLSYYCLTGLEHNVSSFSAEQTPVYEATAVARDGNHQSTDSAAPRRLLSEDSTKRPQRRRHHDEPANATKRETGAAESRSNANSESTQPFSNLPQEQENFRRSANFTTAMIAAGGSASAAEDNASGFAAPEAFADAVAPVPEPAAWAWVGTGAMLLIAFRHFRPGPRETVSVRITVPKTQRLGSDRRTR